MVDFFLIFVNALRQCKMRSKNCNYLFIQSRTQSPLAFWSAGGRKERLELENWKKYKFFDWLL